MPTNSIARPKPKKAYLPLERIVFEPEFQLRDATLDEAYVLQLMEALENGEQLPAIDVVAVDRGPKLDPLHFCIDGWHRSEAARRRGVNGIECNVYTGTKDDARLWALSSNSKQPLARTPADCRRAFDTLLTNTVLLARVIDHGRGKGGTERAIAQACGLSKGVVAKYLQSVGLQSDRLTGKLIPDGSESPERQARQELAAELAERGKTASAIARDLGIHASTVKKDLEATKKKRGSKAKAATVLPSDPILCAVESAITEAKASIRRLANQVESVLGTRYAAGLRLALKQHGFPTAFEDREELPPMGEKGPPKSVKVETWPAAAKLVAAFSDFQVQLYSIVADREAG